MTDTDQTSPARAPSGELMTVEEVADFLRVPVATLYSWRHKGVGPRAVRVGRYLRYRRRDLHELARCAMTLSVSSATVEGPNQAGRGSRADGSRGSHRVGRA